MATIGVGHCRHQAQHLIQVFLFVRAPEPLYLNIEAVVEELEPPPEKASRLLAAIAEKARPISPSCAPESAIRPTVLEVVSQLRSISGTPRRCPSRYARVMSCVRLR